MVLPLSGLVIVEVSSLVAGPAMGSLLQGLGASVVKIEPPVTGDPSRTVSPWGFLNYNCGKKSLSLNLKSAKGQGILHQLIKKADIFIENMGPDVPERLGFSYHLLRKLNPRLIYCSIKGFSSKSQHHNKPAFDAVAQAMSGMMSLTGEPSGEPVRIGNPSIDLGAAAYGTIEVLGAVLERERSRKGKLIEISLLDMSVYWNGYWLTYFGMTGNVPQRLGSGHLGYSPHKAFRTKDNKYVLIATLSDGQWKELSSLLGIDLGSNYNDMKYRVSHRAEVEQAVEDAVSKLCSDEVLTKLSRLVPCAPVRSIDEVYNDSELYEFGTLRGIVNPFNEVDKNVLVRIALSPVDNAKSLSSGGKSNLSVPRLGQDNERILKSLGYRTNEIKALKESGIL